MDQLAATDLPAARAGPQDCPTVAAPRPPLLATMGTCWLCAGGKMHLLPDSLAWPLIWALCALLLGLGLRATLRDLAQDVRRDIWLIRGPVAGSAARRVTHLCGTLFERNHQNVDLGLIGFALSKALRRASLAVPLTVIASKALTDAPVLGLFAVFSDQPQAAERAGRTLLVLLVLALVVLGWTRFAAWLDRVAAGGSQGWLRRNLRSLALPGCVAALWMMGLTPGFLLLLAIGLTVACFMTTPEARDRAEPEMLPVLHAALNLACAAGLVAVLMPLHLLGWTVGGLLAVALHLGILLPLAVLPAVLVVQAGMDRQVARIAQAGPGRLGLAVEVARIAGLAVLGLGVLAVGLAAGLWLAAWLGPEGWRPDLAALRAGLWTDPALGGPLWVLAAVTLWPVLAAMAEVLAAEVAQHSPPWRRARALVAAEAPAEAVEAALMRARVTGWAVVAMLLIAMMATLTGH